MIKRYLALLLSLGCLFFFGCKSQEEISTAVAGSYGVRDVIYNEAQEVQKNILRVGGSGEILRKAELAELCFTLKTEAAEEETAKEALLEKEKTLRELLLEARIPEEGIESESPIFWPSAAAEETEGETSEKHVHAQMHVWVRVRNLNTLGLTLSALEEAGFSCTSLEYMLSDPDDVYAQALSLAVENALEKAEIMAEALDGKLVKIPLSLQEGEMSALVEETAEEGYELPQIVVSAAVEAEFEIINR